ncbi:unnamed protein product [Macrosiphum euphorbiae]|uniref:RNase H type-1 domain-containing protein n=1 Tax=Macrosiphum euphorbiae TaxID=13131 RepID=A0AAV0VN88_9HEMI|nr:unnamed protein product [Macrosiphum euphorbiae]
MGPSHTGIIGNGLADRAANEAIASPSSLRINKITFQDALIKINNLTKRHWQDLGGDFKVQIQINLKKSKHQSTHGKPSHPHPGTKKKLSQGLDWTLPSNTLALHNKRRLSDL